MRIGRAKELTLDCEALEADGLAVVVGVALVFFNVPVVVVGVFGVVAGVAAPVPSLIESATNSEATAAETEAKDTV